MRPHRQQPTRLPRPWDSPGKNMGVGCHVLLQCMKVKSESEVAQSCPTLSDPMDCSPPGSSVHGIFQARILEWGAIAFSVGLAQTTLKPHPLLFFTWLIIAIFISLSLDNTFLKGTVLILADKRSYLCCMFPESTVDLAGMIYPPSSYLYYKACKTTACIHCIPCSIYISKQLLGKLSMFRKY